MNNAEKDLTAQTLKHLNQLAIQGIRQKNLKQAIDSFTQSLVIEEKLGMTVQMAESFYNLAATYFLMGNYQEALNKAQFALTLFRKESKGEDIAKTEDLIREISLCLENN